MKPARRPPWSRLESFPCDRQLNGQTSTGRRLLLSADMCAWPKVTLDTIRTNFEETKLRVERGGDPAGQKKAVAQKIQIEQAQLEQQQELAERQREQADVLARITLSAPPDTTRSAAIAAVREGHATAMQVLEIRHSLQRWAELGKGNTRYEARRALAQVDDDGQGVRWYET
ncbi:hypothetical protein [Paraburkholderia xenovorans]|uniref:hypothetical protein n=1 Tax=Paraburkholderia xenovorans TaxID=36873 RepID=UPI0038BA0CC9